MASQIISLGKYHVLDRLASFGLAEVYKVKTVGIAGFEKIQVLKRILPPYSQDLSFARAFIEEAKVAFSLNHRNIVQVFEFGKVEGDLFIATEYIPGVNLNRLVRACREERRMLPVGLTCYLMGEVAGGLEYAHRKTDHFGAPMGILHCDLNPRNIACSFEGSVKILDFGISRPAWDLVPERERALGRPRYLSPEQVRGEKLDPRSDLFSFGVILWELLTGMALFEGGTIEAVHHKIVNDAIPHPRSINPEVPPRLDEVTMQCLSRPIDQRMENASDLQLELHRIQRRLGAVIGSRALATYLDELFPGHGDTRDVRQESIEDVTAPPRTGFPSAAAAAFAGFDPAALRDVEVSSPEVLPAGAEGGYDTVRLTRRKASEFVAAARSERSPRIERSPVEEPRVAGVLRSGRHPDEEDTIAPRPRKSRLGVSAFPISSLSSEVITAAPVLSDREAARPVEPEGETAPGPAPLLPAHDPLVPVRSGELLRDLGRRGDGISHEISLSDVELVDGPDAGQMAAGSVDGPWESNFDELSLTIRPGAPPPRRSVIDVARADTLRPEDLDPEVLPREMKRTEALRPAKRVEPEEPEDEEPTGLPSTKALLEDEVPGDEDPTVPPHEPQAPAAPVPRGTLSRIPVPVSAAVPVPVPSGAQAPLKRPLEVTRRGSPTELPLTEKVRRSEDAAARARLSPSSPAAATASTSSSSSSTRIGLGTEGSKVGATPEPAPALQTLDEKKRFIAVCMIIDGVGEAAREVGLLVADIAYKLDGIVDEKTPEKVVVLFGLPNANEHDIVVAIRFAIDAREAVLGLSAAEGGAAPGVRIGIREGTARLGGPAGPGPRYQVLGASLAEVEALGRFAPPAEILVVGLAARLASALYDLEEGQPIGRQGKLQKTYRLASPRQKARRASSRATFLGRDRELHALRVAFRETVLQNVQRTVLVVGEPGVGKTSLVDNLLARVLSDAKILSIGAAPHRRSVPNALLVDLLHAMLAAIGEKPHPSRTQVASSLHTLLGEEADEQSKGTLAVLLGASASAEATAAALGRRLVSRTFRKLLASLGKKGPLLVVVEDLHCADSASVECLTSLVEHPEEAAHPLLFLLSTRPEEAIGPRGPFDTDTASIIFLDELDPDSRRRLIREALGDRSSAALVQEVERRAGGNPFYIQELARALRELRSAAGSEVPATVQRVIAGRVDRLPMQVKSVLQHAAVIGPVFRESVLAKLLKRNPARALGTLRNRGFIVPGLRLVGGVPTEQGSEQFEREWAFRHVIVQEVVYQSLSSPQAKQLHRQVGEIMAKRAAKGASDAAVEVARHLDIGGQSRQAGEFYLRAANEAAAAFASRDALELYDKAVGFSEGDAERQYAARAGRERLLGQLGLTARQAEDLEALRQLSGQSPERLADLHCREALRYLRLGELKHALSSAELAESMALEAKDEMTRGEALRLRGEAYERLNDPRRAVEEVTRALEIFRAQGSHSREVRTRITLGRISRAQARYEEAFGHFDAALDLIKQTEDRWQERVLRNDLAVVHFCRGHFSKALGEALYSLKLCEQFGDRAREGDNALVVGIVYLEIGLYETAQKYLELADGIHQETGSKWSAAETLVYLGLLEASLGRFPNALRLLDQARGNAEQIDAKSIVISARSATAWTLCERGAGNDAVRAMDEASEAADLARGVGLVALEIPALSRSARATRIVGDLEAARARSERAVELLGVQRIIESSEEEIHYTHHRILSAVHDPNASEYLQIAHAGFQAKLDRLDTTEWKEAFSGSVRLNAAILRDFDRYVAAAGD
jgi:tetratricopeptide (TPR) repeat protein